MGNGRCHLIFDFTYLYYKYIFAIKSGRMPSKMSCTLNIDGVDTEIETAKLYYPLREIESVRKEIQAVSVVDEVVVSICCDKRSARKDTEGAEYKANRVQVFQQSDYEYLTMIREALAEAGYNVYIGDGIEADDWVYNLVDKYSKDFDNTVIYTPDSDLLINVTDGVSLRRYVTNRGYDNVMKANFEDYARSAFKCYVPYNAILLYKSTVGDKTDNVPGVTRFGPKAFEGLVKWMEKYNVDWASCRNPNYMEDVMEIACGYFKPDQVSQVMQSFNLVKPVIMDNIAEPVKRDTDEKRSQAYLKYEMKSLVG